MPTAGEAFGRPPLHERIDEHLPFGFLYIAIVANRYSLNAPTWTCVATPQHLI